jgi:hypothetical protein
VIVQATSVADVIERMRAILSPLPASDGVACFTRLYLAVTQGVQQRLAGLKFADPVFLQRLDVLFAELFFAAVDSARAGGGAIPRAWAPLFDARSRRGIAPLQFALAGMNAHINRDLPVALVTCCVETGRSLEENTPQHADFQRVNGLLATVESQVRQQYLSGWLRRIDRLVHRLDRIDDLVALWDIARARDGAWINAEALWAIRDNADLYGRYLGTLDRNVGMAGRGLLVPAESSVMRLGRRLGLA